MGEGGVYWSKHMTYFTYYRILLVAYLEVFTRQMSYVSGFTRYNQEIKTMTGPPKNKKHHQKKENIIKTTWSHNIQEDSRQRMVTCVRT